MEPDWRVDLMRDCHAADSGANRNATTLTTGSDSPFPATCQVQPHRQGMRDSLTRIKN
jgi:hypothetical protein